MVAVMLAGSVVAQAQPPMDRGPQDDVRNAHEVLQWTTAGSLLVTATLGTLVAANKPTLFSEGRCASGDPIFGQYGCKGLSVVHGLSAITSVILYTATVTLEFSEFDWPGRDEHDTAFDVTSGVHLGGMIALPFMGIVTAVPHVLGIEPDDQKSFQKVMRTLHLTFGYATVGAYVATAAIELQ